jgi:hypothetical protein
MKYSIILLVALTFQFFSCTAPAGKDKVETRAADQSPTCYAYDAREDKVYMQLDQSGTKIKGTLRYNLNYKDSNDGTLEGRLQEDLLIADYTFQSEGVTSVREVVFRREGDTWVEGYGDVEEKAGKIVFRDVHSLKYTSTIRLQPVSCR